VAAEREELEAYFLFRGVSDDHWDAIETVLERHGLALVLETVDGARIVGMVNDGERRAWYAVQYAYHAARSVICRFALSQVDQCCGISGLRCRSPLVRSTYAAAAAWSSSRRTSWPASTARSGTTFPLTAGGPPGSDVMLVASFR